MADASDIKSSTSQEFTSAKTAVLDAVKKWEVWREEQLQEFRQKQYLESQKILGLSGETQEQYVNPTNSTDPEEMPKPPRESSDASCLSLDNGLNNCDILQESSITGHLKRCFDDSSHSNLSVDQNKVLSVPEKIPIFSEIRNLLFFTKDGSEKREQPVEEAVVNGPIKKRPFLKKGSGLLRYMSKSNSETQDPKNKLIVEGKNKSCQDAKKKIIFKSDTSPKKAVRRPPKNLKLKPAIRKNDVPSEQVKHIRFDLPLSDGEWNIENVAQTSLPFDSRLNANTEYKSEIQDKFNPPRSFENDPNGNRLDDLPGFGSENVNMVKESKELEEFEMLENYAQNSSFNSDSSIVQRMLQGESNKVKCISQTDVGKPSLRSVVVPAYKEVFNSSSENHNFNDEIGNNKWFEDIEQKKKALQKVISDINPKIKSLEKEIVRSRQETFIDSDARERYSPIEDPSPEAIVPSSALPETNFYKCSLDQLSPTSSFVDDTSETIYHSDFRNSNTGVKNLYTNEESFENHSDDEKESISQCPDEACESEQVVDGKSRIYEKLLELEKEIETYQELNAKLSSTCKERDEVLRKLNKERDDFNKSKETERKKIEAEIQEERRQIKRQKESFNRFQKLRKDNPTRKEREELNALRLEVEKLQEELKRQNIRHTSDCRRWKNRIDTAEKERDTFKLENIKLEEQCQDLLTALKARRKKKSESEPLYVGNNVQENVIKDPIINKDAGTQTTEFDFDVVKFSHQVTSKSTDTKSKADFNSIPDCMENSLEILAEHAKVETSNPSIDENFLPEKICETSECNSPPYVTKNNEAFNLSVITVSADAEFKEIDHGNRIEIIYASGEREITFKGGTRKVISADKKTTKFFFYNGDVKEICPDRREIYTYVNGVTETTFPDGLKVTQFPNGQVQHRYPDGKQEIYFPNGTIHKILPDGSKEIFSSKGHVIYQKADGTEVIEFSNGQKEISTPTYKRREFPDGSVKVIYKNGKQETRYSNGRTRIKDASGKVILDTKYLIDKVKTMKIM